MLELISDLFFIFSSFCHFFTFRSCEHFYAANVNVTIHNCIFKNHFWSLVYISERNAKTIEECKFRHVTSCFTPTHLPDTWNRKNYLSNFTSFLTCVCVCLRNCTCKFSAYIYGRRPKKADDYFILNDTLCVMCALSTQNEKNFRWSK